MTLKRSGRFIQTAGILDFSQLTPLAIHSPSAAYDVLERRFQAPEVVLSHQLRAAWVNRAPNQVLSRLIVALARAGTDAWADDLVLEHRLSAFGVHLEDGVLDGGSKTTEVALAVVDDRSRVADANLLGCGDVEVADGAVVVEDVVAVARVLAWLEGGSAVRDWRRHPQGAWVEALRLQAGGLADTRAHGERLDAVAVLRYSEPDQVRLLSVAQRWHGRADRLRPRHRGRLEVPRVDTDGRAHGLVQLGELLLGHLTDLNGLVLRLLTEVTELGEEPVQPSALLRLET